MSKDRKTSIIVGILFIIATIAGVISVLILTPVIEQIDIVIAVRDNISTVVTGEIFIIIMAVSCALIACYVYPILKRYNSALAISYVVLRVMEGTLFLIGVGIMLTIVPISISMDISSIQIIGKVLLESSNMIISLGSTVLLGFMTILFNAALHKYKLVPSWLSIWGIIAGIIQLIGSIMALYAIGQDINIAIYAIPVALQEMVLAVYLITKGFSVKNTVST